MAVDYIDVPNTTRHGANLRQSVSYLTEALERIRVLKLAMDEMVDGADYTEIETQLGLGVGEGQTVYNLTAGALAEIDVANVTQFLYRLA